MNAAELQAYTLPLRSSLSRIAAQLNDLRAGLLRYHTEAETLRLSLEQLLKEEYSTPEPDFARTRQIIALHGELCDARRASMDPDRPILYLFLLARWSELLTAAEAAYRDPGGQRGLAAIVLILIKIVPSLCGHETPPGPPAGGATVIEAPDSDSGPGEPALQPVVPDLSVEPEDDELTHEPASKSDAEFESLLKQRFRDAQDSLRALEKCVAHRSEGPASDAARLRRLQQSGVALGCPALRS